MKQVLMLAVMLLLQVAVHAFAASGSMYIDDTAKSKGVYYLKGVDFVDVGGVEVEIQYDTTTLTNPRINQGSLLASTMFIPNPSFKANSVKIAAMSVSAIKGSGDLAVISFDLKGTTAGPVNIIQRKLAVVTSGAKVPETPAPITSGGGSFDSDGAPAVSPVGNPGGAPSGSSASGSVSGIAMGTISLPTDQMTADNKVEALPLVTELRKDLTVPSAGADAATTAKTAKAEAKDKAAETKMETYNGVLELFKLYQGERSEKALIALFAAAEIPGFVQTPLVALADGKTPLKVTVKLKPSGDEAPKFISQGVNIKQLSADDDGTSWIIEAVPRKGVLKARLTVIDGNRMFDYPLTVAPPIDPQLLKGKKLSTDDFKLYLAKPPKYDWNGDGKFDELDDYIYTANYIVALNIKPVKSVAGVKAETGTAEGTVGKRATEEVKDRDAAAGKDAPVKKEPPAKTGKGKVKKGEKSRLKSDE